jgi:regulatory protein
VAERLRKGFGPLRIRRELRDKGLSDALIEPHLHLSTELWLELIETVHTKRFGEGPVMDTKERGRRGRFLEYRGFPTDLIARFLNANHTSN